MMRSVLLIGTLLVLVGCATVQNRHPDYGTDCSDLAGLETPVDCVRVFFGTNRDLLTEYSGGPERNVVSAGSGNSGQLATGRADIWLPKLIQQGGTREIGETPMLRGEVPDDDKELAKYVFVTRITESGREYFLGDLKAALASHRETALVFVHGFNVKFENALIRSAQLSVDLSQNSILEPGAPMLFSWPSQGKMSLGNYRKDQTQAAEAVPYLKEFLDLITAQTDVKQVNIIAHSMGNRVLVRALEQYASDYLERFPGRTIDFRIILAAADVNRDLFEGIAESWDALQPKVTIYTSDDDVALKVSKLINGAARLGDTSVNKPFIRDSATYETVDATPVASELFGLGHSYYSDNPFILGDILCVLTDTPPDERSLQARNYDDQPDAPEFFQTQEGIEPFWEECSLRRQFIPNQDPDARFFEDVGTGRGVAEPEPVEAEALPGLPPEIPPPAVAPAPPILFNPVTLFFGSGSAVLEPQQIEVLNTLLSMMQEASEIVRIRIEGHTDTIGTPEANRELARRRAEAVQDYLTAHGVAAGLIEIDVIGEEDLYKPTPDDTAEPLNRRVVISVEAY